MVELERSDERRTGAATVAGATHAVAEVPSRLREAGQASFCITRAAIAGLLRANATADEIVVFLILARFTDESGMFSSAGHSALNRYTGANKRRGGRLDRALQRLTEIRGINPHTGEELEPILYTRNRWIATYGPDLPDGPTERGQILHVLSDFEESVAERVWIGAQLVDGIGTFSRPLKTLRQGGDVAARLLLALYEVHDPHTWLGIDPFRGLWQAFEEVDNAVLLPGGAQLLRFERGERRAHRITEIAGSDCGAFFDAWDFLEAAGFIYECITVLDRAPVDGARAGLRGSLIAPDAEPMYELDVRSARALPPEAKERLALLTARLAAAEGVPVYGHDGEFNLTYAAVVARGQAVSVAGIYRLRFRVANPRNGWISGGWAGYFERQREARATLERVANRVGVAL